MKLFFFFSAMLLSFVSIAQQYENILLENFKFRIDKYRSINFSVGGSSNHARSLDDIPYYKNSNFNGGTGIGLTKLKSTEKILQSVNLDFQSNFSFNKSRNESSKGKVNSFNGSLNGTIENKFYSGKSFFLTECNATAIINSGKSSSTYNPVRNKNALSDIYVRVGLGLGNGRLENVKDMQNALWLFRALKDEKILKGQLSGDELLGLGKAITKANNTRVLDSRRRTRFMLSAVDSFLQDKKMIAKTDIQYLTALNDVLFFAINDFRLSGVEKSVKLVPVLSCRRSYNNQAEPFYENEENTTVKVLSLVASWRKHKPINLFHQRNYGVSFELMRGKQDYLFSSSGSGIANEMKAVDYNSKASLSGFLHHYYYPNNRTAIYLLLDTEGGFNVLSGDLQWFNKTSLGCSINYFVSYNTRLTGGIDATVQKNYFDITRILQSHENLSLRANIGLEIQL